MVLKRTLTVLKLDDKEKGFDLDPFYVTPQGDCFEWKEDDSILEVDFFISYDGDRTLLLNPNNHPSNVSKIPQEILNVLSTEFPQKNNNNEQVSLSKKYLDYEKNHGFSFKYYTKAITMLDKGSFPILLVGKHGTGKSSFAFHYAKVNQFPFYSVSLSQNVDNTTLLGHWILKNGKTEWVDGIITTALKKGGVLLLDEWDAQSPEASLILQQLLQEKAFVIAETGETVKENPKKPLKIIATANTTGSMESYLYTGVGRQNIAQKDRFFLVEVVIPPEEVIALAERFCPELKKDPLWKELIISVNENDRIYVSLRSILSSYQLWKNIGELNFANILFEQIVLKNIQEKTSLEGLAKRLGLIK